MKHVAVVLALAAVGRVHGDEPRTTELNREVVLKSREASLKVGKEVVGAPDSFHVYRVERVNGDWLWVAADGIHGWVRASQTVPLEQAHDYFTNAIKARPDDPWAYQMRGLVYSYLRDFEHADADDTKAIKLDPRDPVPYHNRGNVRLARGDHDGALADFNRAIDLDPRDASSYVQRALVWAAQHEYELALADDNQAIRIDPHDPAKFRQRARHWAARKDYAEALADYAEAIKLDPNDALAYNGRAWIWATAPDPAVRNGQNALESAVRARELTGGKNPYILGTLAAASAEVHDFNAAVRWQTEALKLFAAEQLDQSPHRQRLELYRAGKPFRDEPRN